MVFVFWGFCLLVILALGFLFWLQIKSKSEVIMESELQLQLETKVGHLEENLKKTLEIMQDLAKKMHVQQEVLDQTTKKLNQVELQNAELVNLLAQTLKIKD